MSEVMARDQLGRYMLEEVWELSFGSLLGRPKRNLSGSYALEPFQKVFGRVYKEISIWNNLGIRCWRHCSEIEVGSMLGNIV